MENPLVNNDLPERFDLASASPADERLDLLRANFPEVFREGEVDFDALRRSLGDAVDQGHERFGLTWPGKAECMNVIQQPSIGTLIPLLDESVDWETTHNVIIEGENLEALKLLQKAYYGEVKMIYIDPPYNTGKEFIYPDNFREGLADYLRYSGQVGEDGFRVSANAETDGRYHSKWLSMIYPRLFLARNLLRQDGVIFVSIDDHEIHSLVLLLNEIFGEENHVGTIVWKNATDNNPTRIATEHEYIVCYARSIDDLDPDWRSGDSAVRDLLVDVGQQLCGDYPDAAQLSVKYSEWFRIHKSELGPLDRYKYIDADGIYTGSQSVHNPGKEGYRYDLLHPSTGRPCKQPLMGYRFPPETMAKLVESGRIIFGDDENKIVELKVYAKDYKQKLGSLFELDGRLGANELRTLFPETDKVFTNPKPSALIAEIIPFVCSGNDLVLDFFAGSGTTAHAVMLVNERLSCALRFVLVQLPDPGFEARTGLSISRTTMERVRRVAARRPQQEELSFDSATRDRGFRAFRLAPSNFTVWEAAPGPTEDLNHQLTLAVEHVTPTATEGSMLAELLLKSGYPLTSTTDCVDFSGSAGYSVADGALLVCLSKTLTIEAFEAMVDRDPAMILVLDAGFGGSDELKVNALQAVRARNQRVGSDIALRVV